MSLLVEHISLTIGKTAVLRDVSFQVASGEFISLLGASGAGKSTTLKIIAGLLLQDEGHISIGGRPVDDLPTHKRKTVIVFQDMRLFPHMTVKENIMFPLKMNKVAKKERADKADALLKLVQLEGLGSRRCSEISGGQQQRVTLARALAANPDVLLLDEPFSGLDEDLRQDMRDLVRSLHDEMHMTTILVTHDAIEALMMSDRILYMHDGRVVQDAQPDTLYNQPASPHVAACFGKCSTLEGVVENGVFHAEKFSAPTECVDGMATAVVRYHGVRIEAAARDDASALEVTSVGYRGRCYLVQVSTGKQTLTLANYEPLEVGDRVRLELDPHTIFVYPSKAASKVSQVAASGEVTEIPAKTRRTAW